MTASTTGRLAFGGDYNPEQWPESVWPDDIALMRSAGVTMVTVGVFAWARLEPAPDRYDFDWLDRALDLLGAAGIAVDLATATASPPPWLAHRWPQTLPVDADGRTLWPGSRQAYCPSSAVFRERAALLVDRIGQRYGSHPAVALWHVGNEYACHVTCCWCDASAEAFRDWLRRRYGDVEAVNEAWGTDFWSQRYGDLAEVLPPRAMPAFANPAHVLDFRRFSSDEHLACFRAERDLLRRHSPVVPVTTNFMADKGVVDYWSWADEVDVVSNDHYLRADDPAGHVDLALTADTTRGLAAGRPWLLMEHSTSAVNWQPRNVAKRPGQAIRNSLQHVARGADAALFFQWRQSRAGSERWHSALLPHAGTDSRLWREVVELGATLERLGAVAGSRVVGDVAMLWSYDAWWALEGPAQPTVDVAYRDRARAMHQALWDAGLTVDVVAPGADLSGYRLVLVPTLYAVGDAAAARLADYVAAGGHLLVTYASGLVDELDRVRLGGYPGAFRELLGVRVEELCPLLSGERVRLVDADGAGAGTGDAWTEDLHLAGAETVLSYADGPVPWAPALTRHPYGRGLAWYVATRTDPETTAQLLAHACDEAGVHAPYPVPPGVEVVRRASTDTTYVFCLNHATDEVAVDLVGTDLVSGEPTNGRLVLGGGAVAVVAVGAEG